MTVGLATNNLVLVIASLFLLVSNPMLNLKISHEYIIDSSENLEGSIVFDRDMVYEGDLVLDDNESVIIENCIFEIRGRIFMSDNASLILRNAKIRLVESIQNHNENNDPWFQMNDTSRFKALNITIETISFQSFSIHIADRVEAIFDDVYSLKWHSLICDGNSKAQIADSTCWSMIETRDTSYLSVVGSEIYGVNVTGASSVFLKDVYTTKASVMAAGSLEVFNSTISSDSEGLRLVFMGETELILNNFSTLPSGIGYKLCDQWSLIEDNDASNVYINVTLNHTYLKLIQFVVTKWSNISLESIRDSHTKIVCSAENIEIIDSILKQVELLNKCVLHGRSVEFELLKASENSLVKMTDSKMNLVSGNDQSKLSITSSEIQIVTSKDSAILHLNNCSIRDSVSVSDNSVIFQNIQPAYLNRIDYNLTENILRAEVINKLKKKIRVDMILNYNRIREMKNLKIFLNDDSLDVDTKTEKDLRITSFMIPPGIWRLSISLGPVLPERVPFFLSPVGQQLVSLAIILSLVIAVMLTWR